jgi:hypothetical protein
MGLFGFGSKRRCSPPSTEAPAPAAALAARVPVTTKTAPSAPRHTDVEVSELNLDENEFSSTFGAGVSQFAETHLGPGEVDVDPWTSRLRLD